MSTDENSNIQEILAEVLKPRLAETVDRAPGMSRQEWRRKSREATAKANAGGTTRTGLPKEFIPTIVMVDCPKCGKHRLTKYLGDDGKALPVSNETIEVRGTSRLVDVCGVCDFHYREADKRFIMANLKHIQKAMRERRLNPTSDKDFTIDL